MSSQQFIFSNRSSYRISRHAIFWVSWWLYFITTFLLPTFHFPGWAIFKVPMVEKFGWLFFEKRIFIISSLIPVILPQAIYTYIILYFLLPRFFFKPKNILVSSVVLAGMITFTYIASIGFMYVPFYHSYIIGMRNDLPSIIEMIHFVNKSYLFHLPIVIGFAVMIKLVKR